MPEKPPGMIVVLDANALMMPFQFGINIDIELGRLMPGCEIVVPSSVMIELEAVLKMAKGLGAVIVTNDKELRSRAQAMGLRVIGLRGKNHLEML